jgi:hypothetical protein
MAFSPQATYTNQVTAASRRNLVQTFVDRRVSRGQRGGSPRSLISSFILTRAECTPFQTHCYSENLLASGIEPGTSGLAARKSAHKTTEAVK